MKNRFQKRKELEMDGKPAKKRRKFDLIVDWGNEDDTREVEQTDISAWLMRDEPEKEERINLEAVEEEPNPKKKAKLRQLELSFYKEFSRNWLPQVEKDKNIPEGWKIKPSEKNENTRRKEDIQTPKRNMKITHWLEKKPTESVEDRIERHDDDERRLLEYEVRKEEELETKNMIHDLVCDLINDTPVKVEQNRRAKILKKKERALKRLMIGELVTSLVKSIPGQAAATRIMEGVMGEVETIVDKKVVWGILEQRKDIQDWVSEMMRTQLKEKSMNEVMKTARLRKAKMLQDEVSRMDWAPNIVKDAMEDNMEMEVDEVKEHNAIEILMKQLNINIQDMETNSNSEDFEDEIEHEFLDKILQELEKIEAAWSSVQRLEDVQLDECINTYSCTGNCA